MKIPGEMSAQNVVIRVMCFLSDKIKYTKVLDFIMDHLSVFVRNFVTSEKPAQSLEEHSSELFISVDLIWLHLHTMCIILND